MFAWLYDWLMVAVTWILSLLGIQWSSGATSSAESASVVNDSVSAMPPLDPLPLDPTPVSHDL